MEEKAAATTGALARGTSAHADRTAPLTAVRFVTRHRLDVDDTLAALLSSFIDPTQHVTIVTATKVGDIQLLQRVMNDYYDRASSAKRITDRHYIAHIVRNALECAVHHENDLALLDALRTFAVRMDAATTDECLRSSSLEVIAAAVELGKVHVYEWLVQRCKHCYDWSSESVCRAAANGHVRMLEWLFVQCGDDDFDKQRIISERVVGSAAQSGQLHVLEWLWHAYHTSAAAAAPDFFSAALTAAATRGDVTIIKWVLETTPTLSNCYIAAAFKNALSQGRINVVRFLHAHNYRIDRSERFYGMQASVSLSNVQWLFANGYDGIKWSLFEAAAERGDVSVVAWLCANDSTGTLRTECTREIERAATNGHVDVVALLLPTCRCIPMRRALVSAAANGHTAVVTLLLANKRYNDESGARKKRTCDNLRYNIEDVEDAVAAAAGNGHVVLAHLLHAERVRQEDGRESAVCYSLIVAASKGQLTGLQWLVAYSGMTIADGAVHAAAKYGHLDVLVWLFEHLEMKDGNVVPNLLHEAAVRGHVHIVQWLHERFGSASDVVTTSTVDTAARLSHLDIVRYLYMHCGARCSPTMMDNVAAAGCFELLLFLHAHHNGEGCTIKSIERVFVGGDMDMDIVCWLQDNYPHVLDVDIQTMYNRATEPFEEQEYAAFLETFRAYAACIVRQEGR